MLKSIIVALLLACLAVGIGCAALSEIVTPATVDARAVRYAVDAGVADPNGYNGYANLAKAIRLRAAVDAAYRVNILEIQQLASKNDLNYDLLKGTTDRSVIVARQREESLFGEKGLLSMGLTMLGVGGLGGALGLMRKRPGDWTQPEVDAALADAGVVATDRTRQLAEVVKGVQQFLELHPKKDLVGDELRKFLTVQSPDTRVAVATIKATV